MASIQYVVNATDAASMVFAKIAASADSLDKQLKDLGDRVAEPEVDLQDTKFTLAMINAAKRLDKLNAMVAEPGVKVDTTKVQTEILRINALLDRATRDRTVAVKVDMDRSFLSRIGGLLRGGAGGILGGLGGVAAGGISGAGSVFGALGSAGQQAGPILQGSAIAALIASAVLAGPALLPAGLGLGVGGLGAVGAVMVGAKDRAKLLALQKSLAGVTGTTPSSNARRDLLQNQIAAFQQGHGPQLAFGNAGAGLLSAAQGTFFGALTAQPVTMGPGGPVRGQSFLQGLLPVFEQVEGFVKRLQPELADLFRASLPYLGMFVKFLEQTAKVLLPVFTQMLVQMTPYLPLIGKGLLEIVKGFAGFLQAIGPSAMQASAKIFVALTIGMAWALKGLGIAINWLVEHIPGWVHDIAKWWDWMRHHTATVFDGMRQDIAHYWDLIFENSIGMVIRLAHNVETQFNSLRHETAVIFDGIRHDLAAWWDLLWNNTVARVARGVHDVEHWFNELPPSVKNILSGLGKILFGIATGAFNDFLNGLKSVGGSVLGWLKNFIGGIPHAILSFLHMSPPHAGSAFFDLGANIMHHFAAGIQSRTQGAVNAARSAVAAVAGSGGPAAALGQRMAAAMGWTGAEWTALNNVAMRESGWSTTARNPSSGAYGIAQFINGPSEYYQYGGSPGSAGGQITGFLNYIAQRYGDPMRAWQHELSFGWYDRGGYLPTGLSLALNTTGGPERVGGGNTYNINVNVPPSANKADIGRQIVETIRLFEQRSGAGWRS